MFDTWFMLGCAALLLLGPLAICRWARGTDMVVYEGSAHLWTVSFLDRRRAQNDYDFVPLYLHNGQMIVAEIRRTELARQKGPVVQCTVQIRRPLLGRRDYVAWLQLDSERAMGQPLEGEPRTAPLVLAVYYLMLAFIGLGAVSAPQVAEPLGRAALVFPALSSVLCGWMLGSYIPVGPVTGVRLLGMRLGSGRIGLAVSALASAWMAGMFFWVGGLMLIFGVSAACSSGTLLYLLWRPMPRLLDPDEAPLPQVPHDEDWPAPAG